MAELGARKRAVLSVIAGVSLLSAVVVFLFKDADDESDVPDDEASRAPWVCRDCGKSVMLTPREQLDLAAKGAEIARNTGGKQVTSARSMALQCPTCGAFALTSGLTCVTCGKAYLPTDRGAGGNCPDCADKPGAKKRKPSTSTDD